MSRNVKIVLACVAAAVVVPILIGGVTLLLLAFAGANAKKNFNTADEALGSVTTTVE